jgi:hypothetical protein
MQLIGTGEKEKAMTRAKAVREVPVSNRSEYGIDSHPPGTERGRLWRTSLKGNDASNPIGMP